MNNIGYNIGYNIDYNTVLWQFQLVCQVKNSLNGDIIIKQLALL